MVKTRRITIRLRREEQKQIEKDAFNKGYETISAYLRALAFGRAFCATDKILETNDLVKKILKERIN